MRTGLAVGLLLVVLAAAFVVEFGAQPLHNGTSSTTPSGYKETTLESLIAGNFTSASDKHGTGGSLVAVRNLLVLYVRNVSDGDWHMAVSDGKVPVFITEIIPADQRSEGRPVQGMVIDEYGVAFCDTLHQGEAWHGSTCWEIHPIKEWHESNGSVHVTSTSYQNMGLEVRFSYASNPIARGSTQTITVSVSDLDGSVVGALVQVAVGYASGYTTKNFECTTGADGSCSVSWQIGSTATPGTFQVNAEVEGSDYSSSFTVTS